MMDFLKWMFSDIWIFLGIFLMLLLLCCTLIDIAKALSGRKDT